MFLSRWLEFPSVPCLARKKKLDDSSCLDVVEIARVSDMLPSFFLPGRAKDLPAPRLVMIVNSTSNRTAMLYLLEEYGAWKPDFIKWKPNKNLPLTSLSA